MNKYFNLKTLTIALLVVAAGVAVVQCNREEEEREEVVYVRNHNGGWIATYLFMRNYGTSNPNYQGYNYATKNSDGTYRDYKPTANEFDSMKKGTYTGKSMVKAPISSRHSSTGKTTKVGGSSTRSSGIGG